MSGLRRISPSLAITTGVSLASTPRPLSSASASSSSSRSIHTYGIRLRARNSRSRRESGEKREPITLMPVPTSIRIERRAMNAPRIRSLIALSSETSSHSFSSGTWITSPGSRTTPVR